MTISCNPQYGVDHLTWKMALIVTNRANTLLVNIDPFAGPV
jgi:hypothetical protein